jgi:hypothetical protein
MPRTFVLANKEQDPQNFIEPSKAEPMQIYTHEVISYHVQIINRAEADRFLSGQSFGGFSKEFHDYREPYYVYHMTGTHMYFHIHERFHTMHTAIG